MTNPSNYYKPLAISRSLIIATSLIYMGLFPNIVDAKTNQTATMYTALTPGENSPEVQVIQVQLKALGYYQGAIDGNYNTTTQNAVGNFQKALKLKRTDGIVDQTTRIGLNKVLNGTIKISDNPANKTDSKSSTKETKTSTSQTDHNYLFWWRLLSLVSLGMLGISLYVSCQDKKKKLLVETSTPTSMEANIQPTPAQQKLLTPIPIGVPSNVPEIVPSVEMSLMPKVNVAEDLMENLKSLDPVKQRKAIWNLSQKGDSRAIEPLVQLLGSADSQQHSLILSALADISIRNLKPIRKALIISAQNQSPEVRQNAIRDLARIHDMIEQINQTLYISLSDEDPEVQATAKYALKQINALPENHYIANEPSEQTMDVLTRY